MAPERSHQLISAALLVAGATIGCNSTATLQQPSNAGERVAALSASPEEPAPIELSFSFSSDEPNDPSEEESDLTFGADGLTVVPVDEDTIDHSSSILRFTAARRGQETVGVRVFFEVGQEDGDDDTHLGLRRADRIEEVDGLTIAALSVFLEAWHGVGKKPEVRLLVNRAGRPHTVIYRRRSPGTARGF